MFIQCLPGVQKQHANLVQNKSCCNNASKSYYMYWEIWGGGRVGEWGGVGSVGPGIGFENVCEILDLRVLSF